MFRIVLIALLTASFSVSALAADRDDVVAEATALLETSDSYAAIEFVTTHDAPLAVDSFSQLQMDLYWKQKNVRLSNVMAQAGIQLALTEASRIEADDPDMATRMRKVAKAMVYNVGSFNWPGWDEKGVTLTASDIAAGREAATANLRMVEALEMGELGLSRAHWLLGAHELAAGNREAAADAFTAAEQFAREAGNQRDELLNVGYQRVVAMLEAPDDKAARQAYAAARDAVGKLKDGAMDVTQLDTAYHVFASSKDDTKETAMSDALSYTMNDITGQPTDLDQYRGKVVMMVNTASKCGLTPQYKALQALYDKYDEKGFVILGFPANNFGKQEPGTDEQIAEFCEANYGVTFPMFSKISVKGDDKHELYQYLTGDEAGHPGDISWNFEKFLIGRDGKVVARFTPKTKPDSDEVVGAIESQLAQ